MMNETGSRTSSVRGVGFEPTNPSPSSYSTLRDEVLSIAESTLARAVDQASRWLLWATPATGEGSRKSQSIMLSQEFSSSFLRLARRLRHHTMVIVRRLPRWPQALFRRMTLWVRLLRTS